MSFHQYCIAEVGIAKRNGVQAEERRVLVENAKTTTETVSATIKENGKIILDKIMVEFDTAEFSPRHKVLHGSFKADFDRPLVPSFYQLVLEDGRSYRIVIKGVHPRKEEVLAHFLVVPED